MSNWVKAQSQETIAMLIIIIFFAGLGGFFWYRKNLEVPGDGMLPEDEGDGTITPPPFTPPTVPPSDVTVPTGLTCSVLYPVLTMGQYQIGTVSSNGRNYPVTIYAKHRGTEQVFTIAGFLNVDGMWTSPAQLMGTPGYYEFWAELDTGVVSDPIEATVEGIKVIGQSEHYSKTFSDSYQITVVTHYTSTNAQIVGHYPSGGYSQPITSTAINSLGYGTVSPSLDFLANGDWELDALIFSDQASLYTYGSYWVDVGR